MAGKAIDDLTAQATGADTDKFLLRAASTDYYEVLSTSIRTFSNKTFTAPVLNGSITGTGVLDEDAMGSDSDTAIATQQSIKAYGDSAIQTMTNKTLTAPAINTGTLTNSIMNGTATGTAILDEDDMASDSASKLASQQSIKAYTDDYAIRGSLFQNAIINPDGAIDQRQPAGGVYTAATTPANSDDTYLEDQWILLSDGNDVVDVSQETDSPDGSKYSMKYLVATANKKWGVLQILENEDSMPFDNKTVSMGFQVKTTAAKLINNVRCAILSWDSTADTVTSDVVSAWNASGADPTLVANWTYENTPANIAVTTSWADDVSTANVSIDTANMANIAVFIWVDDTDASVGDELFLSQRRMNEGAVVLPCQPRRPTVELVLCQPFYEVGAVTQMFSGDVTSGSAYHHSVNYKVQKLDNTSTVTIIDGGVFRFPSAPTYSTGDDNGFRVSATSNSTGASGYYIFGWTSENVL